jgi:hypothetical protein
MLEVQFLQVSHDKQFSSAFSLRETHLPTAFLHNGLNCRRPAVCTILVFCALITTSFVSPTISIVMG